MGDGNETRRAAAICKNCGAALSIRLGPEGEVRPIGTGQGDDCTCGDGDFRVLSSDEELLEIVDSTDKRRAE